MVARNSLISLWLTAVGVGFILQIHAQQPQVHFQRLNLEEGLSQGTIHCMVQDQKGFMWFGTQDGLNKYDGYKFTVYRYHRQDSSSISDNWINCLFEDALGYLWIGTLSGGLNRFDRAKETFVSYRHSPGSGESLPSDKVTEIFQDHRGWMWIGTDKGLAMKLDHGFMHYPLPGGPAPDPPVVNCIFEDPKQRLLVGTDQGLFLFDHHKQVFELKSLQGEEYPIQDVRSIISTGKDELLVGTQNGLFQVQFEGNIVQSEQTTFPSIQGNKINAVVADMHGQIWIGYDGEGLLRWNRMLNTRQVIRYHPAQNGSLSNDWVYDILMGKYGNIWVGTLNGINRYNIGNIKFRLYQNIPGVVGHTANSVFSITKDAEGNLWTATRQGIYRTEVASGETQLLDSQTLPSLRDNSFRTVFRDHKNSIWIGSASGHLSVLDPNTLQIENFDFSQEPQSAPNPIYCFYEDPADALWMGTSNGLFKLVPEDGTSKYFPLEEIRSINRDSKGIMWIGTLGAGIYRFDPKSEQFDQFRHHSNDPESLSHDIVACIYIDSSDTLWVGTASGFNKFHPDEGIFYSYNIRQGLPGEVVYGILPADENQFWLSTNNGLTRFDSRRQEFRTYHTSDGLQGSEFNAGAYFKANDGELYFGGLNGVNAFYPSRIKDHPLLPTVFLTGFKVLNEDRPMDQSLESVDRIDLSYQDYFFSFEFTALHLAAPERNRYAYKLEGFDRDWIYTDRRFATYTNLDPGNYTFKVKASNNDGVWNDRELAISLVIAPPFWQTWWFYLVSVLLVIGVIYSLYHVRINHIRHEESLKTEFNRKLSEVEMSALRSQMNPHFLFNSLNSINRYIVKSDPETASAYLTKFSRLIRHILHNSKSSTIPLSKEVDALRLYIEMEDLRFENKFDYSIEVDPNIEADFLEVPPMVMQPYVENAIWHGLMHKEQKGKLLVSITKQDHTLCCEIEDNGIGREKAQELKTKSATRNKPMGMKITSDRLSLLSNFQNKQSMVRVQDLKDDQGRAIGTRVTIHIPIEEEPWNTLKPKHAKLK